jgi:FeS assembly SUF system protein
MKSKNEELQLKEEIIRAIKTVHDPEIPVDVYELGLIYDIQIRPINNVYILITLTSPACPAAESIPKDIKDRVEMIKEINDVEVEITFDPPYTTDLMSEEAKLELGFM